MGERTGDLRSRLGLFPGKRLGKRLKCNCFTTWRDRAAGLSACRGGGGENKRYSSPIAGFGLHLKLGIRVFAKRLNNERTKVALLGPFGASWQANPIIGDDYCAPLLARKALHGYCSALSPL